MKTIIILSSPRAGSSMLGAVLQKLGVTIDGKKKSAKEGYRYGYIEDREFQDLGREILIACGSHMNWDFIPTTKQLKKIRKRFDKRIQGLLKKKQSKIWGWKDPSAGLYIELFHPHLRNPKYILLRRNVASSVKSMDVQLDEKKNLKNKLDTLIHDRVFWKPRFLIGRAFDVILGRNTYTDHHRLIKVLTSYYEKMERFVEDKTSIDMDYEDILENPDKEIRRLVRFLGLKPTRTQLESAIRFVNPKLRNH